MIQVGFRYAPPNLRILTELRAYFTILSVALKVKKPGFLKKPGFWGSKKPGF